jgi:hypothetical protein
MTIVGAFVYIGFIYPYVPLSLPHCQVTSTPKPSKPTTSNDDVERKLLLRPKLPFAALHRANRARRSNMRDGDETIDEGELEESWDQSDSDDAEVKARQAIDMDNACNGHLERDSPSGFVVPA